MASHPQFGERTTGTEVAQAFSAQIRGRIILITGVSPNSLGESVALATYNHFPSLLILASRSLPNLEASASKIRAANSDIKIKLVLLDFAAEQSIRHAATQILQDVDVPRIDVLINTAAANYPKKQTVKMLNGKEVELQFATNHVGLFLFTNLLLPKLLTAIVGGSASGATRIVNVTSDGHVLSPIRFSDYNFDVPKGCEIPIEERPVGGISTDLKADAMPGAKFESGGAGYVPFIAYAQSKTGNMLFSLSLNQKWADRGLLSFAVHPGAIWTNLPRYYSPKGQEMIRKAADVWKSQDQGAATILVAAFDPALTASSGLYLSDCQITKPAGHASDPKAAEKLWKLTEELVGQKFDFSFQSQL